MCPKAMVTQNGQHVYSNLLWKTSDFNVRKLQQPLCGHFPQIRATMFPIMEEILQKESPKTQNKYVISSLVLDCPHNPNFFLNPAHTQREQKGLSIMATHFMVFSMSPTRQTACKMRRLSSLGQSLRSSGLTPFGAVDGHAIFLGSVHVVGSLYLHPPVSVEAFTAKEKIMSQATDMNANLEMSINNDLLNVEINYLYINPLITT